MIRCENCEREFRFDKDLDKHLRYSNAHNYCSTCERDFSSPNALLSHYVNSLRHAYCRGCWCDFNDKDALKNHIRTEHWHCFPCNWFFKNERGLKEHYRQSREHHYCVQCDKLLKGLNGLNLHFKMSAAHAEPQSSVRCPGCSCNYSRLSALVLHLEAGVCKSGIDHELLTYHVRRRDVDDIVTGITTPTGTGCSYECVECQRPFPSLSALAQHVDGSACGSQGIRSLSARFKGVVLAAAKDASKDESLTTLYNFANVIENCKWIE